MGKICLIWALALSFLVQTPFVFSESSQFYIKTDRLKYKVGDKINVSIYPQNIQAQVEYADEVKTAYNQVIFIAKPYENKIIAKYKAQEAEAVIYVAEKDRFKILAEIVCFAILNYLVYVIAKKYFGGLVA